MKEMNKEFSLKLIDREEINRCSSSANIITCFFPHQKNPLGLDNKKYESYFSNEKIENLPCICKNVKDTTWYDFLSKQFKEDQISTIWINPSSMPISCFLSCVAAWRQCSVQQINNTLLGIFIPTTIANNGEKEKVHVWQPDMRGTITKETDLNNFIWYPSLARNAEELENYDLKIDAFEIFPITEIINKTRNEITFDMAKHKKLLDGRKIRTEKIMYINRNTPNETFEYIVNSIKHLPRAPSITTPVVTPGGIPINYLSIALAAVVTNTYLITDMNESFSESLTEHCFILKCE